MEFIEFYVSSFWVWLGITIGIVAVSSAIASVVSLFRRY